MTTMRNGSQSVALALLGVMFLSTQLVGQECDRYAELSTLLTSIARRDAPPDLPLAPG